MTKKSNKEKSQSPKARSVPHSRTRADHAQETAEDYVEAVFDAIEEKGECRVLDLARHFAVSHVTVSRIVRRLKQEGLMDTAPYRPVTLTAAGRKLAERSKKRHELVLKFLLSLGIDQKTAEIDSEGIEHHVSDVTLAAMKGHLKSSRKS
jgi:DtxR family manganese transport transcriptional regulator